MHFTMEEAIEILERTPQALEQLLAGLSAGWLHSDEGEGTWSASEVVAHFVEAERHNWITKLEYILEEGESTPFPPFDRFAHLNEQEATKPIEQKLSEFKTLRAANIARLRALVGPEPERHLERTGLHPALGTVKLRELLATWVVHDFTHTSQIVRVMAERYRTDVGPWVQYLSVLKKRT